MEQLSETEQAVNAVIRTMPWCDCDVIPGQFNTFTIACSEDLTYYHTIELIFTDVLFVHCRYDFHVDTVKGLFIVCESSKLPFTIDDSLVEDGYKLYAIGEEDGNIYCVACKGLEVNYDSVLRYRKTDLSPGQRIANWLEK